MRIEARTAAGGCSHRNDATAHRLSTSGATDRGILKKPRTEGVPGPAVMDQARSGVDRLSARKCGGPARTLEEFPGVVLAVSMPPHTANPPPENVRELGANNW